MKQDRQQPTKDHKPVVILLHGLHMHRWVMQPLANRLKQQGFNCRSFGYYSLIHDMAMHSYRLHKWLSKNYSQDTQIYLVGHSLGGLLIRDFLHRYPNWQVSRCVTLGTPHNGSIAAEKIIRYLPSFVGRSYQQGLDGHVPTLRQGIELGSIAGSKSVGLGKIVLPNKKNLASLALPLTLNDGTVFVHETQLMNAKDHIIMPTSHTGMLLSQSTAKQIAHFLNHGEFFKSNISLS